jgi:hypothetical protein
MPTAIRTASDEAAVTRKAVGSRREREQLEHLPPQFRAASSHSSRSKGPSDDTSAMLTLHANVSNPEPSGRDTISRVMPPPFFHGLPERLAELNR